MNDLDSGFAHRRPGRRHKRMQLAADRLLRTWAVRITGKAADRDYRGAAGIPAGREEIFGVPTPPGNI